MHGVGARILCRLFVSLYVNASLKGQGVWRRCVQHSAHRRILIDPSQRRERTTSSRGPECPGRTAGHSLVAAGALEERTLRLPRVRRTSPGEASRLVNVWDRPPAYYGLKGRDTIHSDLILPIIMGSRAGTRYTLVHPHSRGVARRSKVEGS